MTTIQNLKTFGKRPLHLPPLPLRDNDVGFQQCAYGADLQRCSEFKPSKCPLGVYEA